MTEPTDTGFRASLPVLVAVSIASFMVNLDTSIVSIALPTLAGVMNASSSQVSRIILFYLLAIVSTLMFFGRLGDRIGKKPVFLWGYILFTSASVLCGLSRGLSMLVGMRFLQGIGGAMLFATMSAIIIQNVEERHRGKAFSAIAVFSGIGVAVGAPLGGFIVENFGWRWIFYINVIPGILGYSMTARRLAREEAVSSMKEGFDMPGILTSSLALLAVILVMNGGTELGWLSPVIIGLSLAAVVLSVLFIVREKRTSFPLVELGMFRNQNLTSGLLTKLGIVALMNGTFVLFPFFLEQVMGMSTARTGLLLGVFPLVVLFAGPVSGSLTDRIGAGRICTFASFFVLAASMMFLGFRYSRAITLLIPAFAVFGFGIGLFFPANMKLVMSQATAGREGILTAINSLANFLGAALGVAFMETIFSLGFPAVHDFKDLAPAQVAEGFGSAMISGVIIAALAVAFAVWSIRRAGRASTA